jgi:mono/diheme cytochrome c family protein
MSMVKLLLACLAAAITAAAQDQSLAQSRQIVQKVCGVCHTPESVIINHRSRAQWQETIDKMS